MIIAQGSTPVEGSCSCEERSRAAAPRLKSPALPEMPSLDLVSQSLASGEVLRLRNALERNVGGFEFEQSERVAHVLQRGAGLNAEQAEHPTSESGVWARVKRVARVMSTATQELLIPDKLVSAAHSKTELALECVGRVCERLVSGLRGTLVPSWIALFTRSTTETALASIERCFNSVRGFFSEAAPPSRVGGVRNHAGAVKHESFSSSSAIPRVVVKRHKETQSSERRHRSRSVRWRRELAELNEEADTVEVELIETPDREHKQPDSKDTPEEKRTGRVCRRIREIDAQYGTTPNNPKVAELISQLGTHYDSIERVIETVYSLQLEEMVQEQKVQAAERIRERKWLQGESSSES